MLVYVGHTPKGYGWNEQELPELSEFVNRWQARTAVYWYCEGAYEGCGCLLVQGPDDLWHSFDLSHCSCYGPTDRLPTELRGGLTFDLLKAGGSQAWMEEDASPLIHFLENQVTP